MKARDLTKSLKETTKGWVAVNEKNEVVACDIDFAALCQKVEKTKKKLAIIPAAKDYSGLFAAQQVVAEWAVFLIPTFSLSTTFFCLGYWSD